MASFQDNVKQLQQELIDSGKLTAITTPNGNFGKGTYDALKQAADDLGKKTTRTPEEEAKLTEYKAVLGMFDATKVGTSADVKAQQTDDFKTKFNTSWTAYKNPVASTPAGPAATPLITKAPARVPSDAYHDFQGARSDLLAELSHIYSNDPKVVDWINNLKTAPDVNQYTEGLALAYLSKIEAENKGKKSDEKVIPTGDGFKQFISDFKDVDGVIKTAENLSTTFDASDPRKKKLEDKLQKYKETQNAIFEIAPSNYFEEEIRTSKEKIKKEKRPSDTILQYMKEQGGVYEWFAGLVESYLNKNKTPEKTEEQDVAAKPEKKTKFFTCLLVVNSVDKKHPKTKNFDINHASASDRIVINNLDALLGSKNLEHAIPNERGEGGDSLLVKALSDLSMVVASRGSLTDSHGKMDKDVRKKFDDAVDLIAKTYKDENGKPIRNTSALREQITNTILKGDDINIDPNYVPPVQVSAYTDRDDYKLRPMAAQGDEISTGEDAMMRALYEYGAGGNDKERRIFQDHLNQKDDPTTRGKEKSTPINKLFELLAGDKDYATPGVTAWINASKAERDGAYTLLNPEEKKAVDLYKQAVDELADIRPTTGARAKADDVIYALAQKNLAAREK